MFNWLRELLDIKISYQTRKIQLESVKYDVVKATADAEIERDRDSNICESCETLKMQLAIANQEKKDLLNRLLTPPATKPEVIVQNPRAVIPNRHNSFAIKRKALEAESRANAALLAEKAKESSKLKIVNTDGDDEIAELEKEMNIAAAERESNTGA